MLNINASLEVKPALTPFRGWSKPPVQPVVLTVFGSGYLFVNEFAKIRTFIIFYFTFYLNSSVERYLSPVSGRRTTMFLPSFSGSIAALIAP